MVFFLFQTANIELTIENFKKFIEPPSLISCLSNKPPVEYWKSISPHGRLNRESMVLQKCAFQKVNLLHLDNFLMDKMQLMKDLPRSLWLQDSICAIYSDF